MPTLSAPPALMLPPTPRPPGPVRTNDPVVVVVLATLPNNVMLPRYAEPHWNPRLFDVNGFTTFEIFFEPGCTLVM